MGGCMIQIFGINKNFDVKKAQMWFKERRIAFQFVDLKEKEMSRGEFDSVVNAISKSFCSKDDAIDVMIDKANKNYSEIAYLDDCDKLDKLFENQMLLKMPVCRNGKDKATVGLDTKTWEMWK